MPTPTQELRERLEQLPAQLQDEHRRLVSSLDRLYALGVGDWPPTPSISVRMWLSSFRVALGWRSYTDWSLPSILATQEQAAENIRLDS